MSDPYNSMVSICFPGLPLVLAWRYIYLLTAPNRLDALCPWVGLHCPPVSKCDWSFSLSPFSGLQAHVKFPIDYPYSPPTFRFLTKMWHPNIYEVRPYTHRECTAYITNVRGQILMGESTGLWEIKGMVMFSDCLCKCGMCMWRCSLGVSLH